MVKLVTAIVEHSIRIMTFQHNGKGLPSKWGGPLVLLVLLSATTKIFRDSVDPEGLDVVNSVVGTLAYYALMAVFIRPSPAAIVALTAMVVHLVAAGLHLAGVTNEYAFVALYCWEVIALITAFWRAMSENDAAAKNQPTEKN